MRTSRTLLALAACIFAFGGVVHALAYVTKASAQISGAQVPAFFAAELRGLWISDSTTLLAVAFLCGFIAMRPTASGRPAIMLIALVPAAIACVLYAFLGGFYAAHMLLFGSAMVAIAGYLMPSPSWPSQKEPGHARN